MHLEISNLMFAYPDQPELPVIDIEYWAVNHGESIFIHGPSGSGKSTLLNLLGGMLLPQKGSVSVAGHRLDAMSDSKRNQFRANHIGFVFQQFNLIPYLTPLENIELAQRFGKAKSSNQSLNEAQNLLTNLSLKPDVWHQASGKLSVGEQQRVAIARALINKPSLLIADEPTSSLDEQNKQGFISLLTSIAAQQNLTLIFVSHDQSLAQYFDRVEVFDALNKAGNKAEANNVY